MITDFVKKNRGELERILKEKPDFKIDIFNPAPNQIEEEDKVEEEAGEQPEKPEEAADEERVDDQDVKEL